MHDAEAELAAAKGRAHRKVGSRSSLGSELEAFSPVEPEIGMQHNLKFLSLHHSCSLPWGIT